MPLAPPTLTVLGTLALRQQTALPLRRKERALLAYLAITGKPHTRHHLLSLFVATAADPSAALRLLLSRIRQLDSTLLLTTAETAQFNPTLHVDYHQFTTTLAAPLAEQPTDALTAALALYQGEPLTGLELEEAPEFTLWLLHQRAHLRTLYEQGLLELVERGRRLGQWDEAIRWAQQLATTTPLHEAAHNHLIWLYGQIGQPEASAAQYEQYRQLLHRELGLDPSPTSQALLQEVLRQRREKGHIPPPTTTTFVGRTAELADLHHAWQRARKKQGTLIWLEAEAGQGKTQLVRHFAHQLALPLLMGDCYESASHLAYAPWVELLEQQFTRHPHTTWRQLPLYTRTQLAHLLPHWATHLAIPEPTHGRTELDPERLFQAIMEALLVETETRPLLLFIDNLQWADESSLRLAHFLARRMAHHPCLFILATRPLAHTPHPPLHILWRDVQRLPPHLLRLNPLSAEVVQSWVAQQWPHHPPAQQQNTAHQLHRATGGNPLFLAEMFHTLPATAALPAKLPIPPSVGELVQTRLQQLPLASQTVIQTLAVLDVPATAEFVQTLSGHSESETILALDTGVQQGLLRCDEQERFRFFHDLVREAVGERLTAVRRRLLHRQVAHLLANEATPLALAAQQERAGHIWRHAQAGGDDALLFHWGRLAAQHAANLYAYGEAMQVVEAVCEAYQRLPPEPTRDEAYLELLLQATWLASYLGRPIAEESAMLAELEQLLVRYPHPTHQARYHLRQANLYGGRGQFDQALTAALNAYEHFMDLADVLGAAQSLNMAGSCLLTMSHNQRARHLLAQALALYRTAGAAHGELTSLTNLAWADLNLGQVQTAIHTLHEAVALAEQLENKFALAHLLEALAAAHNFFRQSSLTIATAERAIALCQQMGLPSHRSWLHTAVAHWHNGAAELAQNLLAEVFQQAEKHNDLWPLGWAAQYLGRIALHGGDLPTAEQWLTRATAIRQKTGERSNQVSDKAWLGRLRLAQGYTAEALALTQEAISSLEALADEFYVWEADDVYEAHLAVLVGLGQGQTAEAAHARGRAEQNRLFLAHQILHP